MNRSELVEIIYALQQEEEEIKKENEGLKAQLEEKNISVENTGSIAEAALKLNGVFEAAQEAADQYLESIKEQEEETKSKADGIIAEAEEQAAGIIKEAEEQAAQMMEEAKRDIDATMSQIQNVFESSPGIAKYRNIGGAESAPAEQ